MTEIARRHAMVALAGLIPAAHVFASVRGSAAGGAASGRLSAMGLRETSRDRVQQDPALVKQMVGWSHGNIEGVRGLLEKQPELAKAQWDWGFGDWESAIGAASHVGNREIARVLLEHGARATLFTHAMLGHLEVVRATIEALPDIKGVIGPHGITLMSHARAGGDESKGVVEYLEGIGGCDVSHPDQVLTAEERRSLHGTYVGEGLGRQVVKDQRDFLVIEPEGGTARRLFHHGGLVFNPAGAGSARVEFHMEGRARMVVRFPDPVLEAVRV